MPRNAERDREIFDAVQTGQQLAGLAKLHALTPERIQTIVIAERHRRTISPEPFYRSLRRA
jgi:Mor family transcriptional regulator